MPSLNRIAMICSELPFGITPQAQLMLKVLLDCVVDDPHPLWRADPEQVLERQAVLTRALPSHLREIREYLPPGQKIVTTFDILHWLSTPGTQGIVALNRVCPFDK